MAQKLSPNEIRDITALLEAGKTLPEKYRFVLFGDQRSLELVWDGKSNAFCDAILPFQVIEQVDEPRSEELIKQQMSLFDLQSGRQLKGWSNKLIWGDNKFILSSLKKGSLRDEIEKNGGIKLVYIDPPFDVGANFKMDIQVGDESIEKDPNILEELAYRDTWGKGTDSFAQMIYERISLIHPLINEQGSIFVQCDYRVNYLMRSILNEVFGEEQFINEITWKRQSAHNDYAQGLKHFGRITESIFFYAKNIQEFKLNPVFTPYDKDYIESNFRNQDPDGRRYSLSDLSGPGGAKKGNPFYEFLGIKKYWVYSEERMKEMYAQGRIVQTNPGTVPRRKKYLDEMPGISLQSLWTDVSPVQSQSKELLGYPTQKPEQLIERIIQSATNEGDIVADFFVGSGTTASVAEKTNRKWIASDLGKFAIHTTRKRLIQVQRQLKKEDKNWRAFEILNLGKYERGLLVSKHTGLESDALVDEIQKQKDFAFEQLILQAYGAERIDESPVFAGKKFNRYVSIGPINLPVTRLFVERVIEECRRNQTTKADILAFEYEMGLFPNIQNEARDVGIDLQLKYIPRDIFDKRALQSGSVKFHDVAYIDVNAEVKGNQIIIQLSEYSVGYQQDDLATAELELNKGSKKVVIEQGQVIKIEKSKDGIIKKTQLTKHWSDWIDYWAIDYDFQNRKEIVSIKNEITGDPESKWTGEYIFENEWQSFRTRGDRKLELTSTPKEVISGQYRVAIKVVDIFGNDTMKVITVKVGK